MVFGFLVCHLILRSKHLLLRWINRLSFEREIKIKRHFTNRKCFGQFIMFETENEKKRRKNRKGIGRERHKKNTTYIIKITILHLITCFIIESALFTSSFGFKSARFMRSRVVDARFMRFCGQWIGWSWWQAKAHTQTRRWFFYFFKETILVFFFHFFSYFSFFCLFFVPFPLFFFPSFNLSFSVTFFSLFSFLSLFLFFISSLLSLAFSLCFWHYLPSCLIFLESPTHSVLPPKSKQQSSQNLWTAIADLRRSIGVRFGISAKNVHMDSMTHLHGSTVHWTLILALFS